MYEVKVQSVNQTCTKLPLFAGTANGHSFTGLYYTQLLNSFDKSYSSYTLIYIMFTKGWRHWTKTQDFNCYFSFLLFDIREGIYQEGRSTGLKLKIFHCHSQFIQNKSFVQNSVYQDNLRLKT